MAARKTKPDVAEEAAFVPAITIFSAAEALSHADIQEETGTQDGITTAQIIRQFVGRAAPTVTGAGPVAQDEQGGFTSAE